MKKNFTKAEFIKLSFNDKLLIFESLLPDEYFSGQIEIGFWTPENISLNSKGNLLPTPPEIKKEEGKKMEPLIRELTETLFSKNEYVEFNFNEI